MYNYTKSRLNENERASYITHQANTMHIKILFWHFKYENDKISLSTTFTLN